MDSTIFYKLDREKQRRIINAALYVFTQSSFKHASTDDIAARAKVAKGSLFQYFKNKRTLYIFLYEYCLMMLSKKLDKQFDVTERDYFSILKQSMELKFMLLKQHPNLYQFVIRANEEQDAELKKVIEEINKEREESTLHEIYNRLDYSKFTEGTDVGRLGKMIAWCSEGLWNEGVKNGYSVDELHREGIELLSFFKKAAYKEEYQ